MSDSFRTQSDDARDAAADVSHADMAAREMMRETEDTALVDTPKAASADTETQHSFTALWLAEQSIGAPITPVRKPLGARVATLLGRRHGALLVVCVGLLWAALTLRPPDQGRLLRRGDIALDNIVAPRAARILDRRLTEERKRAAAVLVPPAYDGVAEAPALALSELQRMDAARRDILLRRKNDAPEPTARPTNTPVGARNPQNAASARGSLPGSGAPTSASAVTRNGGAAFPLVADDAIGASQRDVATFNARLKRPLPEAVAARVLAASKNDWKLVESAARNAVRAAYADGNQAHPIRSDHLNDDLASAHNRMQKAARSSVETDLMPQLARAPKAQLATLQARSEAASTLAFALAREVVRHPNFVFNERKTAVARRDASDRVPAAYSDIQPGTVMVEAGARIDDATWAQLQDLDLVASRVAPEDAAAHLVLCVITVGFCAVALSRFHPRLLKQPVALWLSAMLPIAFIVLLRVVLRVPQGDQLMVPLLATAAMTLTLLFDLRIGLLGAFLMTALGGIMARADSSLFAATMISSSVGALAVANIASHRHLVRAALLLGGASAALSIALNTLRGTPLNDMWRVVLWNGGTGAAAVGIATIIVMLLERPFGVSTHLGLLELAAPGEELMLRLQKEAPGTYTHSVMVSQMSEAAAKAVGADPLLCRVGGLYHDIGKLRRPSCFVENQGSANIHEHLTPQMSAILIIAHVQDGIDLGRVHRLPEPVLDIIAQHHGATLLAFFLHRARQLQTSESTDFDEAAFRYPGPRPQSKEAAIVLLADTVEASARALSLQSFDELQNHIRTMTLQRLHDGELADCDLTMRDVETVQHSFAQVLRGALHKRIEYPKPDEKTTETTRVREWPWAVRNVAVERRRLDGARENTISALNAHLHRAEKPSGTQKFRRRADDFPAPVNAHENRTSPRLTPQNDESTNGNTSHETADDAAPRRRVG